jgi:hypothetical protein
MVADQIHAAVPDRCCFAHKQRARRLSARPNQSTNQQINRSTN